VDLVGGVVARRRSGPTEVSGDTLVLYTDGVIEAMGPGDQQFGGERTVRCLAALADRSCEEIVREVRAELARFAGSDDQYDDITMLVLRLCPTGAAAGG